MMLSTGGFQHYNSCKMLLPFVDRATREKHTTLRYEFWYVCTNCQWTTGANQSYTVYFYLFFILGFIDHLSGNKGYFGISELLNYWGQLTCPGWAWPVGQSQMARAFRFHHSYGTLFWLRAACLSTIHCFVTSFIYLCKLLRHKHLLHLFSCWSFLMVLLHFITSVILWLWSLLIVYHYGIIG